MTTKILFICLIGLTFYTYSHAQTVQMVLEPALQKMQDRYVRGHRTIEKKEGWRIQFYSSTDRRTMETTIRRMKSRYPDVKFTWIYTEPYYKARAGAFASRSEALPLLIDLKSEFPGAYPILDKIEKLELLESY